MKILLLGDANVGKSDLLCVWSNSNTPPFYSPTIGVDFKIVKKIHVWEGAGGRPYSSIVEAYVKGCDAFIIAYTWDNLESMKSVMSFWIPMVMRYHHILDVSLVRCKMDLDTRCPDPNLEKQLHQLGYKIFETSSVTKQGIKELFEQYKENEFEQTFFLDKPKSRKCPCFP